MDSKTGRARRKRLLKIHDRLLERLDHNSSPSILSEEAKRYAILQGPPLSWDSTNDKDADRIWAQPMPAAIFEEASRGFSSRWKGNLDSKNCPWASARSGNLRSTYRRCGVGEAMDRTLHLSISNSYYGDPPSVKSAWKSPEPRGSEEEEWRRARRHMRGYLGAGSKTTFYLRGIRRACDSQAYGSHAWCAVADGSLDRDCEPNDRKILRSEIRGSLLVARDRIKLDRSSTKPIYPVVVVSHSMFYVRILQIYVDPVKCHVMFRKTPYLHIDSRESDNFKLLQRWYLSHPTGNTRLPWRQSPRLEAIKEEGDNEGHPTTREDGVTATKSETEGRKAEPTSSEQSDDPEYWKW